MTPKYTEDKRLLGALDYIDDKFIAEVTESYKIFEPSDGKITARRTLKISLRQFAALAACLILLSAAFPVTNYVVKAIKSFAAGWGSETTEKNSLFDDSFYLKNSDIFKYTGKNMTVDEVYADVLNSGWAVTSDNKPLIGQECWDDFLKNVEMGKATSVLVAEHYSYEFLSLQYLDNASDYHKIYLKKLLYDGENFSIIEVIDYEEGTYQVAEYLYLTWETFDFESVIKGWRGTVFYLTNDISFSLTPKCEHYAIEPCDCTCRVIQINQK